MLTFSQLYLRPRSFQEDSERMRVQVGAAFRLFVGGRMGDEIYSRLLHNFGVEVPRHDWDGYDWQGYIRGAPIGDLLDLVTIVHVVISNEPSNQDDAPIWLRAIQAAFDTHHLKYRVCDDGVVRLRVDEEFEEGRATTLSGLQLPRYGGVRHEFEAAHRALSATAPDLKFAVRAIFEAVESAFKLMVPEAQRLAAPQLGTHLTPLVARHYAADRPAQQAADKLVQGFTDWVASAQFYRHGQGKEEPNQPPLEVAVAILSQGASHLRWLIHLDQAKLAEDDQG